MPSSVNQSSIFIAGRFDVQDKFAIQFINFIDLLKFITDLELEFPKFANEISWNQNFFVVLEIGIEVLDSQSQLTLKDSESMASTSGTKKPKGPKLPEKTYLPDSNSDEDAFEFSFLDFSEETFKAPLRLCDDQLLKLLCDENVLRRSIDGMVDDGDIPGV
ncbi:unnamed protein product [Lactuca saligna]|uniref:Uncharacterized protein n=1 Tax=Lactuca saligna TaxID=75948 RepID=A0AA36E8K7_LACSI|nr:unnamed protein product [Lactuca saligna]